MLITPSMMVFSLVLPQSATRTQLRTQTRFIGEGATSPDYDRARETIRTLFAQIIEEDIPMMERLQETSELREELNLPTRFSPHWERGLHLFQLSYSRMMHRSWAGPQPGPTQSAGDANKNP
jgi:choline monooxygenase